MAYDGSLVFDTRIDTGGFSEGIQSLQTLAQSGDVFAALRTSLEGISTALMNAFLNMQQLTQMTQTQALPFDFSNALNSVTLLKDTLLNGLSSASLAFQNAVSEQNLASSGAQMIQSVASGMNTDTSMVFGMNTAIMLTKSSALAQSSQFNSVGLYMASGIASGISAGASGIIAAMQSAVQSAISAAKAAADIHSPSKVFDLQVGRMFMKGVEQGIEVGSLGAISQMDKAVNKIVQAGKSASGKFALSLAPSALNSIGGFGSSFTSAELFNNFNKAANTALQNNLFSASNAASNQSNKSGSDINLYMTVNSANALSESELTRQAQDFLLRARRKLP